MWKKMNTRPQLSGTAGTEKIGKRKNHFATVATALLSAVSFAVFAASPANAATVPLAPAPSPDAAVAGVAAGTKYVPLTPARLLDTRIGNATVDGGGYKGVVAAGQTVDVQVTGRGGVPASGVGAVVLNVTAVTPAGPTWVAVWPTGETRPNASSLNVPAGDVRANAVIAKVGAGGKVSVYNNSAGLNLIIDVNGWYPSPSDYNPLTPARLLDTRIGKATVDGGGYKGVLTAGQSIDIQVTGRGGVPASGVGAVVLNVTATDVSYPPAGSAAAASLWQAVWPTGTVRPNASNLNVPSGDTRANAVIAKVGAGGKVSLYNSALTSNVVIDVGGWFGTSPDYTPLSPARLLDTRLNGSTVDGGGYKGVVSPGQTVDIQVTGRGGIPQTGVGAVVLNVGATEVAGSTWMVAWPTGETRPNASSLNVPAGDVRANAVIAKVGAGGKVSIFNSNANAQLFVDVSGWMSSPPGSVAAGGLDGCGVTAAGEVVCGVGTANQKTVKGFSGVTKVASAETAICTINNVGAAQCAGANSYGQLGNGNMIGSAVAVNVSGLSSSVVDISSTTTSGVGTDHFCAATKDGSVWCWGANISGQNGNEKFDSSAQATPFKVPNVTGATAVSAGNSSSCAIVTGGAVQCWGSNLYGQLGSGSNSSYSATAVAVSGLTTAKSLSASEGWACAAKEDGTVWCWGTNAPGLGDGTHTTSNVPVKVSNILNASRVSVGEEHACALLADATVKCWGSNYNGELGVNPPNPSKTPVAVSGLKNVVDISAGFYRTVAATTPGVVAYWGYVNDKNNLLPVQVSIP